MKNAVRFVFIALAALFSVAGLQAQAYDIDIKNLPSDAAFRKRIDEFVPLYPNVAAWSPDWKSKVPKAKVIFLMEALHNDTQAYIAKDKSDNLDLLLFRSLMKFCLYNANITSYHAPLVKELTDLQAKFPKDYRPAWLLANHYASHDEPFKAVKEYDKLMQSISSGKGSVFLLQDYLTANFFTFMPARCKATIENIAEQNKVKDIDAVFWMYRSVLDQLREPPVNTVIPESMLYTAQSREFETGFLARPLGIWIPLKSTWTLRALPLTAAGGSYFGTTYPLKNAKGAALTASMSITFQVNSKISFEDFMKQALAVPTKNREYSGWKPKWPAQVYEYWDDQSFKQNGGGHGLVVFVKRSTPAIKGLAIEAPAKIPSKEDNNQVGHVVIGNGYTRFDGEIYYAFILDCPEEIFKTAKDEFLGFLDRVLLD